MAGWVEEESGTAGVIILGLDPGSRQIGWARYDTEADRLTHGDLQRFRGDLPDRLEQLREFLPRLLPGVGTLAFEKMFSASNFGDRALHAVASIIQCAAKKAGLPCYEIPCKSARLIVMGDGGAGKEEAEAYLRMRLCLNPEAFRSYDVSDAALIAMAAPAWPEHQAERKARRSITRMRASKKALTQQLELDLRGR